MTTKFILKKGAMFGLDARIALAIFATLSIIAGAALYNARQQAVATAWLTKMTNFGKSWEQYYVDTGQDLTTYSASYPTQLSTQDLMVDPGITGWKGPYLSAPDYWITSTGTSVNMPRIDSSLAATASIRFQNTNENWDAGHHYYRQCRVAGWKCGTWVVFDGFPNDTIFNKIDEEVDEGDGPLKGIARKKDNAIHLMVAPKENPLG